MNKDKKKIVGAPGGDHCSRGRAGQSKESERKVGAQSAQHEPGAVGECESRWGWPASAPPAPAQIPWIIGVRYLINSTLLLLSALSILSIFWLLPA